MHTNNKMQMRVSNIFLNWNFFSKIRHFKGEIEILC